MRLGERGCRVGAGVDLALEHGLDQIRTLREVPVQRPDAGIKVSPYALGAMMFGAVGNPDHDESIKIIHRAMDAGINVIDTADMYSHGESEEIVGKALKGRRDDVVLATKARLPMGEDPNHQGASRRWLVRALEGSLRRLATDYVDVYQIHRPDDDTDIEETGFVTHCRNGPAVVAAPMSTGRWERTRSAPWG